MRKRIVNTGNAEVIEEKGLYPSKIGMIKYENTFDFFSTEPISISIQKKKEKKQIKYSEIFRIRKWEMDKCVSWSVYSKDREKLDSLVLKKVVWEKKLDKDDFMIAGKGYNNEKLNQYPTINSVNTFVSNKQSDAIYKLMKKIDKVLEKGISFDKDIGNLSQKDTELLRLYDWGQIHFTWGGMEKAEGIRKKNRIIFGDF